MTDRSGGAPPVIQGVIFDVGGVLVLPGEYRRPRWASKLEMSDADFTSIVWAAIDSRGADERAAVEADLVASTGLGLEEVTELLDDFHAHWRPNVPLIEYLAGLRGRYPLVVLANAGGAARFAFEEVLGLHRIFDKLLISAEIGMGKPQPEAYRLAVETFGVPADRCIFVDDVEEYVAAAAAIGIHAERHTSNEDTLAWLESMLHA